MVPRPTNHVTQALDDTRAEMLGRPIPGVDPLLLSYLEEMYPPVCYRPGKETLEEHLIYAGKAELVQMLRASHEERIRDATIEDDREAELDAFGAEIESAIEALASL